MKKRDSAKPKRIRQPFTLGAGTVKVILEFDEGSDVRWSSTHNSVSVATGSGQLAAAAPAIAAPAIASGPRKVVSIDEATSVERSGQEFTTNVSDEGPGIGGPGIEVPEGVNPLDLMGLPIEAIQNLNKQAQALAAEKGAETVHTEDDEAIVEAQA